MVMSLGMGSVLLNMTGVVVEVTIQVPSLSASVAPEATMRPFDSAVSPAPKSNVTIRVPSALSGWATSPAKSTASGPGWDSLSVPALAVGVVRMFSIMTLLSMLPAGSTVS